jgi:hypothetical protein
MKIGDRIAVRGIVCEVFRVHACGTYDVVALDGSVAYRISGFAVERRQQ